MRKFAGFFLGALLSFLSLGLAAGLAGCGGGNGSGHFAPPPGGNTAEYLFASADGQLMAFSVDANTGALGAPVPISASTDASFGLQADPAGKFLYVSDPDANEVHVFSIASNGNLTEITGSPYVVGSPSNNSFSALGLAMDPDGKFLYATDIFHNDVAGFTVNSSTGALTAISGSPFSTGAQPAQVVVDASGMFAYVSDLSDINGGISAFKIGGSGALTPVPGSSPFYTLLNGGPWGLATTGQYLYVTESNTAGPPATNGVAALSIISGTGGLNPVSPEYSPAGNTPIGAVLAPSGKFLYVANYGDGTISGYSVDANSGALTAVAGSPFATAAAPGLLAVDPSGKFLYATNPSDNVITGFTINSNGSLTQFSGAATAAGTQPVGLTVVAVPQ